MKITKIEAHSIQDQKSKARALSNSQQKTKSLLVKKKNIPFPLSNLNDPLLITKPLRLAANQNNIHNLNIELQLNDNPFLFSNNNVKQGITSPLNGSGKFIQNSGNTSSLQKEIFLQYIQAQLRIQNKQEIKTGSRNKIKLPQINKINQNIQEEADQLMKDRQLVLKYTLPLQNSNNNSLYEKSNKTSQNMIKQTLETRKNSKQGTGTFINIKSVIPKQKISAYKKKDHSLRDLRILRKQRQQPLIDRVMEELNSIEGNNSDSNNKFKSNTALIKRGKGSEYNSPLRLTADKKRSHLDSGQKLQKYPYNNIRQKKSFSINQNNKKKFAINYMDFCLFISSFNKIKITNSSIVSYKAFVGKGNNSILVKNAIKNRFWWNIAPQKNDAEINFLWQQSKCPIFLALLESNIIENEETKKQSLSQKQIQVKKIKYHLQNKNEEKINENVKEFVHSGFLKLLSSDEGKEASATPYYVQIPSSENLPSQFTVDSNKAKIHNHLQFNAHLTNKKALFYNLKTYYQLINDDPFKYIPLTFHVKQYGDQSWNQFKQIFQQKSKEQSILRGDFNKKKKKQKNTNPLWIIKPGENTNRGCGIQVSDSLQQIAEMVRTKTATGKNKSSIIQRYLMPFLYQKRKFDIRCYMLTTSNKGIIKGYWYEEGYIRTSCKQFTTKNLKNRMIHLTNDAVQKKSQDYGKYQNGNKVSFVDFQRYLDNNYPDKKYNLFKQCYPQMMKLAKDTLNATYQVLDINNKEFTFEVFGLDFMIDEDFNTWLIQVNNNPCLELSSPLLARIIPHMIENAFKVAIDPIFPPPVLVPKTKTLPSDLFESNKYTLIFNSADVEQKVQHFMSENKINLSKIIEGEDEEEQLADEDEDFSQNINIGSTNTPKTGKENSNTHHSSEIDRDKNQQHKNNPTSRRVS